MSEALLTLLDETTKAQTKALSRAGALIIASDAAGDKGDEAVIDPTLEASSIALLKGVLTRLASLVEHVDQIEGYVDQIEGYVDQLEGHVDGIETLLTTIKDTDGTIMSGVATAGSLTTITDTSKNMAVNFLASRIIKLLIDNIEYYRTVASNTKDTITFPDIVAGVGATADIGSGGDGTVTITVDATGVAGNAYTVVVDGAITEQDRALLASLVGTVLTVYLATEGLAAAETTIGSGDNGVVTVTVDAAGTNGNSFTIEVVEGVGINVSMGAAIVDGDIVVTLGTKNSAKASTTIGAGENGVVTVTADTVGVAGNDFTVAVDNAVTEQDRPLSAVLTGSDIAVQLATEGSVGATADIGSGDNGVVTTTVTAPGTEGNDYTIEVDAAVTEQDRVLSATLVGEDILVKLATEGDAKADATIGSGENGAVVATADAAGTDGNDFTIEVTAVLTEQDKVLSAALNGDDILVELATEGDAKAGAAIGTGANGVVNAEADAAGTNGNAFTIEVTAALAVQDKALSAALVGSDITVELATEGDTQAASTIGSGENGSVDIEADVAGTDGNGYTAEVQLGVGADVALSAALVGSALIVTLGTTAAVQATDTITSATGAPAASFSVTAKVGTTFAEAAGNGVAIEFINVGVSGLAAFFDEGDNKISIDFGGDATITAANIALEISSLVVNAETPFIGAEVQAGNFTLADDVGVTTGELIGGVDAGDLDAAKNTATLVAAAISAEAVGFLTATASGTGVTALTVAEGPSQFTGGTNKLNTTANTATLVAAEVAGIAGVTATASGDGSASLTTAEGPTQFAGGTNKLNVAANTATLVAGVVAALSGVTAAASGTGVDSLTAGEGPTQFTGGTNKIHVSANTATLVAAEIDALDDITSAASGTGADSITAAVVKKNFTNGANTLKTSANTALLVAAEIAGVEGVTAAASGDGSTSLTEAVVQKNLTGGLDGGDLDSDKNTATLIKDAIHALAGVSATVSGTGATPIAAAIAQKSFTGGTNQLDDTANTALLVATEIDSVALIAAAHSGTGATPLTAAEGPTAFTGGVDEIVATAGTSYAILQT